jgi:hypothetical protein
MLAALTASAVGQPDVCCGQLRSILRDPHAGKRNGDQIP